jgi:phage FluMu protein Com
MPIEFRCTQCNKLLRTGDDTAGKQAKCPECGAVMTVPLPDQGPVPPSRTMGSFEAAPSPFAAPSAPSDTMNPYQSPTSLAPDPSSFASPGEIRPTRIYFGETFSRTWSVFSDRWLEGLGAGVIYILIIIAMNIVMQVVNTAVVAAIPDPAVAFTLALLSQFVFQVFALWLMLGVQLFTLGIVRGEEARFGLLFAGGRFLLTALLCYILVQIIVAGPAALVVAACYLAGMQLEFAVLCGLPLLIIPGWIFAMMFLQAQILIIDRNLGAIEALSLSRDVMVGNKAMAFVILLVACILAGLFTLVTCFFGILVAGPYLIILSIVIYLGVTRQPTMADRHMLPPEQPIPGTPPGNSPFAS